MDLLLHPFLSTAKESSIVFKDIVDEYTRIKQEEEAATEVWSLTIKAPNLVLKTRFNIVSK